jgi:conjugative transfer signal peptidase TraF
MLAQRGQIAVADRRPGRAASLAVSALGSIVLALPSFARPVPVLVYNASASAPLGFYRLIRDDPHRNDFVLARLPPEVARLAAERNYVPASVPVVKRVAALVGDFVCADSGIVVINGRAVATTLLIDHQGRPLPAWKGCRALANGEVFLLTEGVAASFDGRYFGPVSTAAIVGKLQPLWTW